MLHVTCTNVYGRVRAMFWTIFDRTDMKISLYRVVFRVEFDGDVRFFVAPPKSTLLSIFIYLFDVFCNLFVFRVFVKILIFFFRAAAEPKSLPPPPPRHFIFAHQCRGVVVWGRVGC